MNSVSALVVGTNIGSDIFQQNFILPLVAIIGVVVVEKKHLIKDMGGLILAAVLVLLFSLNGTISRLEGGILFFGYLAYLFLLKKHSMADGNASLNHKAKHVGKDIMIIIVSFIVMAFAADQMLRNSVLIVKDLDISASFFGIVLLGIVTAFPELITALVAVFKKKAKISAGVLIGSNITNPMFALGLGALISGYSVPSVVVMFDLPIKIITGLLILWFLWDKKMRKCEAGLLILLYFAYILFRMAYFPVDVI